MNVAKCKRCGRLFQKYSSHPVCPECAKKEEEEFLQVKAFIAEHPEENVESISRGTGVERHLIVRFM